jgi:hypothetical protein
MILVLSIKPLLIFINCLALLYHVKATPNATSYLGLTLDYDTGNCALILSMPDYILALLQLHCPLGVRLASSPSIYIPPKYDGSSAPQMTPEDNSPPASVAQKKELQEVTGSLIMYYTIFPSPYCHLSCLLPSLPTVPSILMQPRLFDPPLCY